MSALGRLSEIRRGKYGALAHSGHCRHVAIKVSGKFILLGILTLAAILTVTYSMYASLEQTSLLLETSPQLAGKLQEFRDAGILIALDDFGTGYSALSYLNKFRIDFLKIDRSFISNRNTNDLQRALPEAIIAMAHKLDLKVIAEGIENISQEGLLRRMDCDFGQGYLYSQPLPIEQFERLLAQQPNQVTRMP